MTGVGLGRVVLVTPSFSAGGAERVTVLFANGLAQTGADVRIVSLSAHGPLLESLAPGVPVDDLGQARVRRAIPSLILALRRYAPASVVVSAAHVAWALLSLRPFLPDSLRIVVRSANLPSLFLPMTRFPRAFSRLDRFLIPRADLNLATSRRMRDELVQSGVRPKNIAVIPNPVDEASIRTAAVAPRRVEGGGRRFVAVGRLVHQKGFDRLIDVARQLPRGDHVLVLGDGALRNELLVRARAGGVHEQVRFKGFTQDPWVWMAGADALLMPSRTEGMPNVALEALACGTPVVASPESGGIAEIAEVAPRGAVTVLPVEGFAAHLVTIAACEPTSLRPSLLPDGYRAANAVAALVAALRK